MFKIKPQFVNNNRSDKNGFIDIHIDDNKTIRIKSKDNSDMTFEDFTILCDNDYDFLFDFSKKIISDEDEAINKLNIKKWRRFYLALKNEDYDIITIHNLLDIVDIDSVKYNSDGILSSFDGGPK